MPVPSPSTTETDVPASDVALGEASGADSPAAENPAADNSAAENPAAENPAVELLRRAAGVRDDHSREAEAAGDFQWLRGDRPPAVGQRARVQVEPVGDPPFFLEGHVHLVEEDHIVMAMRVAEDSLDKTSDGFPGGWLYGEARRDPGSVHPWQVIRLRRWTSHRVEVPDPVPLPPDGPVANASVYLHRNISFRDHPAFIAKQLAILGARWVDSLDEADLVVGGAYSMSARKRAERRGIPFMPVDEFCEHVGLRVEESD